MAAVGATGFAAVPAQAADTSRGTLLVAQEHDRAAERPAVPAASTDPGNALTARIRAQAGQRTTTEDAARRQAAQQAAAKQARALQIAAQARAQAAADQAAADQARLRAEAVHAEAAARVDRSGAVGTLVAPVPGSAPGVGFGQA